jgi:hypothetical protein
LILESRRSKRISEAERRSNRIVSGNVFGTWLSPHSHPVGYFDTKKRLKAALVQSRTRTTKAHAGDTSVAEWAAFSYFHPMFGKKGLTADQKLEIRDEVAASFKNLPGDVLKIIEKEVATRLEGKAKYYSRLIKVSGVLGGLLVVAVTGVTWSNLQSRIKEVTAVHSDVEGTRSNIFALYAEMTNTVSLASQSHAALKERIGELEKMDNIVTAQKLKTELAVVEDLRGEVEQATITTLRLAALSGDAFAYDKLRALSTNTQSRFAGMAAATVTELEGLTGPFSDVPDVFKTVMIDTSWDLNLGFTNSMDLYRNVPPESKPSVIQKIWNATNYSKGQRMEFLVGAALSDRTIKGRMLANRLLNEEVKTNIFFATDPSVLQSWWKTNKVHYEQN